MEGIEGQMQGITRETTLLLEKTNSLAEDVQGKSQQLNSLVGAVKGFGDSVQGLNSTVQAVTSSIENNVAKNSDQIGQVVQWSSALMGIRSKLKEDKQTNVVVDEQTTATKSKKPLFKRK